MSQHSQGFDPNGFHVQGAQLWRVVYPILLAIFYLLILLGWIFLGLKWWLIALANVYLLVGICNFNFVVVPSTAVRSKQFPSIGELLYTVLLSPLMLLFFPIVHLVMVILIMLQGRKR